VSAPQIVSQVVYLAIFVVVAAEAIRRPRRSSIDAALFFGDIALLVGLGAASAIVGLVLTPILFWLAIVTVLALPLLLLRLADDYAGVPPSLLWATTAGFALGGFALGAFAPPYPPPISLTVGAYFILPLVASAVIFTREAIRLVGLNRIRMASVAGGTALLVLTTASSVGRNLDPGAASLAAAVGTLASLGSALAYVLAFAPPRWLRRLALGIRLRPFLRAVTRLADVRDLDDALGRLERATAAAIGAPDAAIRVGADPEDPVAAVVLRAGQPTVVATPTQARRSLARVIQADRQTAVLGAPIRIGGTPFGVLLVHAQRAPLFGDDDLEFLALLADQAAIVIENAQLLAEVRRLSADETRRGAAVQARLATIVESSADAIIGKTLDGRVTDWNPGAERLYGYTAEEMVGRPIALLAPPDRPDEIPGLLERVTHGERIESFETVRRRKDASLVELVLSVSPIPDPVGRIIGAATIARDVSEQHAAARQRAALEGRLRQSERLESIGRLVGGIAHDFNNLLAIVLNYADFIAERLGPDDPIREDLAQIQGAAERATTFTRQLLTFARRDAVRPEELDLSELLRGVQALLRRTLPESIAVELQLAPDVWVVLADRGQVEQLLLNLVVNAGDAMPNGGTLLLRTRNERYDEASAVQHADLRPGSYVELTVTDSGHGMTADVQARAFEPFFTTKAPGRGTGLGLSTVYGIVQLAGGRVSIYSEVDRGTSVRVLFPAIEARVASASPLEPKTIPTRGGATVLVVEDETGVREAARRILEGHGFRVLAVSSADAALKAFDATTEPIDLLLTDMVMPGLSGQELAERLRAISPNLRIAYMTGYSEELVSRNRVLDGPLLQKPFTREPLLAAVALALRDEDR